jgi:hypothetical protein
LVVENFIVVPYLVAGTDRVGMVQRRLAERMVGLADVGTFDLPFGTVRMVEPFWCTRRTAATPATPGCVGHCERSVSGSAYRLTTRLHLLRWTQHLECRWTYRNAHPRPCGLPGERSFETYPISGRNATVA